MKSFCFISSFAFATLLPRCLGWAQRAAPLWPAITPRCGVHPAAVWGAARHTLGCSVLQFQGAPCGYFGADQLARGGGHRHAADTFQPVTTAGPESRPRGAWVPAMRGSARCSTHPAGAQLPAQLYSSICRGPGPLHSAARTAGTLDNRDGHGGDGRGGGTRLGRAMQGRTRLGSSTAGAVHSWRGSWRGPKQLETGPATVPRSQGRAQLERCTAGSLHS